MDFRPEPDEPHDDAPLPAGVVPWDPSTSRKPAELGEWGYVARGMMIPSTREQLAEMARSGPAPALIWTPDSDRLLPPWEVPHVFAAMRERMLEESKKTLAFPLIVFAGLLFFALTAERETRLSITLWLGLAAVWAAANVIRYVQALRLTPASFARQVQAAQQSAEVVHRPLMETRILAGVLIAVGLAQMVAGMDQTMGVALVKPLAREGEWWRMLTGTLVHGNLLHFFFNFGALLSLGRLIEAYAGRPFVPLVFLVTALGGSAASMLIRPDASSVGASGGLMGMIGFLGIVAWRRKGLVPPGLLREMLMDVGLIALMGVVAYQVIDNAAHGGGLITGALVGLLLVPAGGHVREWAPSPALRTAGMLSLGIVLAAAAWTLYLLLGPLLGGGSGTAIPR